MRAIDTTTFFTSIVIISHFLNNLTGNDWNRALTCSILCFIEFNNVHFARRIVRRKPIPEKEQIYIFWVMQSGGWCKNSCRVSLWKNKLLLYIVFLNNGLVTRELLWDCFTFDAERLRHLMFRCTKRCRLFKLN